jgi:diguanylate cyclase (GGDEF)-like protein
MADLDGFKQVNDTLGHLVGDEVLREAASRMQASVRLPNSIGRYGGEEFLIVLPGCDFHRALRHAERIRSAVCARPVEVDGLVVPVTCSIGVSSCTPDGPDTDRLIRDADEGLYRAKQEGRNRVAEGRRCAALRRAEVAAGP